MKKSAREDKTCLSFEHERNILNCNHWKTFHCGFAAAALKQRLFHEQIVKFVLSLQICSKLFRPGREIPHRYALIIVAGENGSSYPSKANTSLR